MPRGRPRREPTLCSITEPEQCQQAAGSDGLCRNHRKRKRLGRPLDVPLREARVGDRQIAFVVGDSTFLAIQEYADARRISRARAAREIVEAAIEHGLAKPFAAESNKKPPVDE